MSKPDPFAIPEPPAPPRQIFVNRTLNLRRLRAIGYDMDYTLVHYHVHAWEARAFHYMQQRMVQQGWPVGQLTFDAEAVIRGLIIDTELGNLIKVNRFGYVKRAQHGTRLLDYETQRRTYARTVVDLADPRWVFLNTFFSVSEAHMYALMVDMLDAGELPLARGGYDDLYKTVRDNLDAAHMEGQLKADIMADPESYVALDPDTPLALLDQRDAGKKLMLITNSGWEFTRRMMAYAFDRFLPEGTTWRDLFDLVIVSARKPAFFLERAQLFEVVSDDELLRPASLPLEKGRIYFGGSASLVEEAVGCSGGDILYVGDHVYGDVHVSKSVRRWRTGLIVRELEGELEALQGFRAEQGELTRLMEEKVRQEYRMSQLRLNRERFLAGRADFEVELATLDAEIARVREGIVAIDEQIRPLALGSQLLGSPRWGLLMRSGNDKSYFARQMERHADIYTSRVSNFLFETPFVYLRSHRGSLPHDGSPLPNPHNTD